MRKNWDGETCSCCTREQRLIWSVVDNTWLKGVKIMRIVECDNGCVGCVKRKKVVDKCSTEIKDLPIEVVERLMKECEDRLNILLKRETEDAKI